MDARAVKLESEQDQLSRVYWDWFLSVELRLNTASIRSGPVMCSWTVRLCDGCRREVGHRHFARPITCAWFSLSSASFLRASESCRSQHGCDSSLTLSRWCSRALVQELCVLNGGSLIVSIGAVLVSLSSIPSRAADVLIILSASLSYPPTCCKVHTANILGCFAGVTFGILGRNAKMKFQDHRGKGATINSGHPYAMACMPNIVYTICNIQPTTPVLSQLSWIWYDSTYSYRIFHESYSKWWLVSLPCTLDLSIVLSWSGPHAPKTLVSPSLVDSRYIQTLALIISGS